MENTACAAFEEYEEVTETVPLKFMEDDVMWVTSKLSGGAGTLGAEAIDLHNWILCFGCALEDLRVFVARLAEWMANSPFTLGRISCTNGMSPSGSIKGQGCALW